MKSIVLGIIITLFAPCVFAQNLVFVFLHHRTDITEPPQDELTKIMDGHMANIKQMVKEGKLLVAGPFEGGGGIFIFNSSSIDEVKQWLRNDPGVVANRWNVEFQHYYSHVGKPQSASEPYEMTSYNFVRFIPYIAKFNINDVPELLKKHDDYVKEIGKTGNVVAEGSFGETEGGIVLIKGDLNKTVIESDPAVHNGLLETEIKKLYTARGAFGEK